MSENKTVVGSSCHQSLRMSIVTPAVPKRTSKPWQCSDVVVLLVYYLDIPVHSHLGSVL